MQFDGKVVLTIAGGLETSDSLSMPRSRMSGISTNCLLMLFLKVLDL
jgi:hypothetical protein